MAQRTSENEIINKIELNSFSNRMALDMGLKIIALAESRNQHIAVEICRLNHSVFLYVDDKLPVDKHNWLRRKANVAKQFEERLFTFTFLNETLIITIKIKNKLC